MAHYRIRYVESWVRKMLGFSSIVGLFGHRQVGKTSLAERLAKSYFTLDNKDTLLLAQEDPTAFLMSASRSKGAVVIDECQLAPALFPALKEFVRVHKRPGQFLLTGSVRFTSRRAIRESLTGRIINIVIPPLGTAELCEISKPNVLEAALTSGLSSAFSAARKVLKDTGKLKRVATSAANYASTGGLPGICFIRDSIAKKNKLDSQLETILERDLRLIYETTLPYSTLLRVLIELAANVGEPLNLAAIQRKTRVSVNTLKKLLTAFNAMFLVEVIPTTNGSAQPLFFFTDTAEALHLAGGRLSEKQIASQVLYSNIVATCSAMWNSKVGPFHFTTYRTRGGAEIPLVINTNKGALGILPWCHGTEFKVILAQTKSFTRVKGALGVIAVPYQRKELNAKKHHDHLVEISNGLVMV